MLLLMATKRGQDEWGSGEYGASRGSRTHNGVDYCAHVGNLVCSPATGIVTKLGYPYADDLSYRYVEVTSELGFKYRLFYVEPTVKVGDEVEIGSPVGKVQDLTTRYKGITNHVHFEIKDPEGDFINPEDM